MDSSNTNPSKRRFSPTASAVSILLCLVGAILVLNLRDDGQLNAEPPATVAAPYWSPTAKQSVPPQPVFAAEQLTQAPPTVAATGSSNQTSPPNRYSTQDNLASDIHREISELDESLWETEQALLREKIAQLRQRLAEIENKFHERERRFQTSRRNRTPSLPSPIGLPLGPPDLTNQPPRFDSAPSPSPSQQDLGIDPFTPPPTAQPVPRQQNRSEPYVEEQPTDPFEKPFDSQLDLRNPSFVPQQQQQQQSPFAQPDYPTATPHNTPFLAQEIEHEETIENRVERQQRTDFADEKSRHLAIEILGLEVRRAQQRLESARQSVENTKKKILADLDRIVVPKSLQSTSHKEVPGESRMELRKSEEQLIDAEIELKRALLQQQQALAQDGRNQEQVGGYFTFPSPVQSKQSTAIDRELLVLDVEQAKFELETAQNELERVKRLYTSGAANQQDLAEATSRKHSAEISLRRAELLLKRSDLQQGSPPVEALDQPSDDQLPTQEPLNDEETSEQAETPALDSNSLDETSPEENAPEPNQDATLDLFQQSELNAVPSDELLPVEVSLSP